MLFTELKKIQDNDIEQTLAEKLEARGIDPSILQQELGGTEVTVEQLISEVVEGLIAQAADANRESFRARQRKGFEQAQAAGKSVGRRASRPNPSVRCSRCTRRTRSAVRRRQLCWVSHAVHFIAG